MELHRAYGYWGTITLRPVSRKVCAVGVFLFYVHIEISLVYIVIYREIKKKENGRKNVLLNKEQYILYLYVYLMSII